jgi:KaiC/GvpD/RAD55 family RecA-like ATPase
MANTRRKSTGIAALDNLMQGGLKEKSITLLEGESGCGKSTLAVQFLLAAINAGDNAVYMSVEESKESFIDNMGMFHFPLQERQDEGKLLFFECKPQQLRDFMDKGVLGIEDEIRSMDAKIFVLDSITAFALLHETEAKQRSAVQKLFERIRSWGLTTIVVSEAQDASHGIGLQYLVDGWVRLYYKKVGQERVRTLEVLKMRGTKHETVEVVYRIESKGINIYPQERILA